MLLLNLMNPKLTHVAIVVSNLEKTIDFYTRYCNLKVLGKRIDEKTGHKVSWLGTDFKFVIVAIEGFGNPVQSALKPMDHFGFSLESKDDVDKIAAIARNEGILESGPHYFDPVEIVGYICIVLDPDGNSVEFSYGQKLG